MIEQTSKNGVLISEKVIPDPPLVKEGVDGIWLRDENSELWRVCIKGGELTINKEVAPET